MSSVASDVQQVYTDNPGSLPAQYGILSDISIQSIVARIDGTGAAGSFIPTLSVYSQDGKLIARVPSDVTYAVGDTGVVTWSPFLARRVTATNQRPSAGVNSLATAPQVVASGAFTKVNWPSLNWDNDGIWNAGLPTRLTPSRSGLWLASAYVYWAGGAGGQFREIRIEEGLTARRVIDGKSAVPAVACGHNISGVFNFVNAPAAGEYLEVTVIQNDGGGLVVNSINLGFTLTWLGTL